MVGRTEDEVLMVGKGVGVSSRSLDSVVDDYVSKPSLRRGSNSDPNSIRQPKVGAVPYRGIDATDFSENYSEHGHFRHRTHREI